MPPAIASVVFALLILGLFWLDRDQSSRTSGALWIAVVWWLLACSRSVGQWLQMGTPMDQLTADRILEGSPIDLLVYSGLLALGLVVLVKRRSQVVKLLQANGPIILFFLYCAVSILWSDYPEVAFKRWNKALGDLVMVLVVLSDREPSAAFERLLARTTYLLVPLSVLLIKYYPDIGRGYPSVELQDDLYRCHTQQEHSWGDMPVVRTGNCVALAHGLPGQEGHCPHQAAVGSWCHSDDGAVAVLAGQFDDLVVMLHNR